MNFLVPGHMRGRAQAELDRRKRMVAMKEDAERDFLSFIRMMWPVLEPEKPLAEGWILDLLCDVMMAISDGHLTRVCINVPPGSMKSSLLNCLMPAWEWGPRNLPHMRYLSISYSTGVPIRDNLRFASIIKHPVYQACWGDRVKVVRDGAEWVGNDRTGWKMVTSTGGGVTGFRGDRLLCLPYETVIETNHGPQPIGRIVEDWLPVKVLGYGPSGLTWQGIDGHSRSSACEIISLAFEGGSLSCTPDHPIWIEGCGWIAAADVRSGDAILARDQTGKGDRQELNAVPDLRDNGLLDAGTPTQRAGADVQLCVPGQDDDRTGQSGLSDGLEDDHLRMVRQDQAIQGQRGSAGDNVLPLLRVQTALGKEREAPGGSILRGVRQAVHAQHADEGQLPVLLDDLQERWAREADGQGRQWPVRPRECCAAVPAGLDHDTSGQGQSPRWERLLPVPDDAGAEQPEAMRSPHRLRQGQSGPREPNYPLPLLSRPDAWPAEPAPGVVRKVVTSVVRSWTDPYPVYNIRVGPDHTYFANGVLTHNCDDLNNPGSVESDVVRDTTNRFVREIMPSRVNDLATSAIINLQQRTHQRDATGTLLEHGQGYTFVCVPAEFDPLRIWPVVLRRDENGEPEDVWVDPRSLDEDGRQLEGLTVNERGEPSVRPGSPMARVTGESFWPERFPDDELATLRASMTPYSWDSQFNQYPGIRGGAIIRRDWWRLWQGEYPAMGTVVVSVDTAVELGQSNDYNAVTAWGAFEGLSGEPLFLLLAAWRDRLPLAQLVSRIADTCRERRADYLLIEHKTRGRDVHDEIIRLYSAATWQTVLVKPDQDKVSRLKAVSHLFSGDYKRLADGGKDLEGKPTFIDSWTGGLIYAPDRDWAETVITEVADFPYGEHDDFCDTVSQALAWCRANGVVLRKTEFEEMELERNRFRKAPGVPYAIKRNTT